MIIKIDFNKLNKDNKYQKELLDIYNKYKLLDSDLSKTAFEFLVKDIWNKNNLK